MWPAFDQDLTNHLVKCYLKIGRSKVSQVDYPLTNIRLIIFGQCYEYVPPHLQANVDGGQCMYSPYITVGY